MRRTIAGMALATAIAAPLHSHAAMNFPVAIVGFQYVYGAGATVDPLNLSGGLGSVVVGAAGLPLHRGDSITFTNADALPHTVTKCTGSLNCAGGGGTGTWTALNIPGAGGSKTLTIGATFPLGTYVYQCTLHPGMRGAFVVS